MRRRTTPRHSLSDLADRRAPASRSQRAETRSRWSFLYVLMWPPTFGGRTKKHSTENIKNHIGGITVQQGRLNLDFGSTTGGMASGVRRQQSGPNSKKYSDKFIKYTYIRKKLLREMSVTDTEGPQKDRWLRHSKDCPRTSGISMAGDTPATSRGVAIDACRLPVAPKKSSPFLSQGLKSNDMLKLRSDSGRFHINISKIPLRI